MTDDTKTIDDTKTRDRNWMQTFTGRKVYPCRPDSSQVCIEDVAHHLSMQCRYAGASRIFYSVAEHCCFASVEVEDELMDRGPPALPARDIIYYSLLALLHDAAEAYVQDIIRPLKAELQPRYSEIEFGWARAIAVAFGLNEDALVKLPPVVEEADQRMVSTEKRDIMAIAPSPWFTDKWPAYSRSITGWAPHIAEKKYIERFEELSRILKGKDFARIEKRMRRD